MKRANAFEVVLCASYKGKDKDISVDISTKEIYFNGDFNDLNGDGDNNDWINLYDIADRYDHYRDFENKGTKGTPICFGWEQNDFLTRFLLHEIGHKMNFGYGNRVNGKLTSEDARIDADNPTNSSCMYWGLIDLAWDSINREYDVANDFWFFNIKRD